MDQSTFKESFKVAAEQMVDAVKKVIHEGNVRRIVIKQEGRTVAEFPIDGTASSVPSSPRSSPRSAPWRRCSRNVRSKSNGRSPNLKSEIWKLRS